MTSIDYLYAEFRKLSHSMGIHREVPPRCLSDGLYPGVFVLSGLEVLLSHQPPAYILQPCVSLGHKELGLRRLSHFHAMCQLTKAEENTVEAIIRFVEQVIGGSAETTRVLCPREDEKWRSLFRCRKSAFGIGTKLRLSGQDTDGYYYRVQHKHRGEWVTVATIIPFSYGDLDCLLDVSLQAERLLWMIEGVERACDISLCTGVRSVVKHLIGYEDPYIIDCLRTAAAICTYTTLQPGGKGRRHQLRRLLRTVIAHCPRIPEPMDLTTARLLTASSDSAGAVRLRKAFNRELLLLHNQAGRTIEAVP